MHESRCQWRQKRKLDALKLVLQAAVVLMWVLGADLQEPNV